ncbi:VanZ family protein [Glycomyces sp. NRRL B-16210]|uniref:VanZ family protein n=1 Tax=Glycomyces sp. NRRL B-16210 TaxID=1463821 RepID=UPI000AA310CD|nr:VanZ family protein [Glycomyces sp. NRRL B-16210]
MPPPFPLAFGAPLAVNALESTTMLVSLALVPLGLLLAWALASVRLRRGVPSPTAWRHSIAEVGMVAGTLPWLFLVLTPRGGSGGVQLVPFADLVDLASADPRTIVEQLVGNLLLFFLAGVFVPLRFKVGLWAVFLGGAVGASLVETAQFAFGTGRVASVDDVLLNAVGALLGALASRHWWRSSPALAAERAETAVLRSAGRDWRVTSFEVSRGTDRAARC